MVDDEIEYLFNLDRNESSWFSGVVVGRSPSASQSPHVRNMMVRWNPGSYEEGQPRQESLLFDSRQKGKVWRYAG